MPKNPVLDNATINKIVGLSGSSNDVLLDFLYDSGVSEEDIEIIADHIDNAVDTAMNRYREV